MHWLLVAATLFAPGTVSTGHHEFSISFAPDERAVYWTIANPGPPYSLMTILTATRKGTARWSAPDVASFSGRYRDLDPFVSPDGKRLFFMSYRSPSSADDSDLFFVERVGNHWTDARNAGAINSPKRESYPSVATDGALYFGSDRDGGRGGTDIYVAQLANGEYRDAINISVLNTDATDGNPYIAPDESYLVFASNRSGGEGESDLYITFRRGDTWTAAVNLGKSVNTSAVEYCPAVSPDGQRLYFTRFRSVDQSVTPSTSTRQTLARLDSAGNGLGDIYWIEWPSLLMQLRSLAPQ